MGKESFAHIVKRIEVALDSIRPFLEADGGDIRILNVSKQKVEVELLGACSSCAMSPMTLKAGVEEAIKKVAPEIKTVVAISAQEEQLPE